MKRFFVVVLATLSMTLNIFAVPKVKDKTLAIVNDEPIFESDFNKTVAPLIQTYKQTVPVKEQTDQKIKELKDYILKEKINEVLILQEAKKQKSKISKKEIADGVNNLKKMFKNEAEFNSWLKEMGITIADLKNRIMTVKFLEKTLMLNVKIPTEAELKAFYDKVLAKIKNTNSDISNLSSTTPEDNLVALVASDIKANFSERVRIKCIFISCPKRATDSKIKMAQEKVAIVKRELKKQTFVDVVKQYSEDQISKTNNGDFGMVVKNNGTHHPNISKIAFSTKVGDYTKEPIKTDDGYYFIKVEEKHASKNITFDNVKSDIKKVLQQYNMVKAIETYIANLSSKASIKISKSW